MDWPTVTIIVPTYARPGKLAGCLQSIASLDYPRDRFDVVVVDDGSQDPPRAVVASYADRLDVQMVSQSHAGPAVARNTGAERAKGEILAFTDDDCAPESGWLSALALGLHKATGSMVGGRTVNALRDNPWSAASQCLIAYLYAYYNADPKSAVFFASNNLALPADRFQSIGGFDTAYSQAAGEDRDLCDRWLQSGYRMVYARDAVVYHAHDLSFPSFWRQHLAYGRGAFRFRQARVRRGLTGVRMEPIGFYLNMVRYASQHGRGGRRLLLPALLLTSQMANVVGFLLESRVAADS